MGTGKMAATRQDELITMTVEELSRLLDLWRSFYNSLDLGGVLAELVEPPSVEHSFNDIQTELIRRRDAGYQ